MTATTRSVAIALSANDRFKLRYPRTLKAATLAALAITAVAVWLSPSYQPRPYVLRTTEFTWVEVPDAPPIPDERVEPAPPPVLPPVLEVVDDGVEVDPFDFPDWSEVWNPPPPAPPATGDDAFVASSAKPVLAFFAKPDYPALARHAGLEGTVMIHVLVGTDGRVVDAVVVKSVHPLLDRAAQQAARLCRFTPAKQREIPVKAWLAVPYVFRLR